MYRHEQTLTFGDGRLYTVVSYTTRPDVTPVYVPVAPSESGESDSD